MTTPLRITSRQNQRVKDAARLRIGRERQRSGRFIIDGAREITRAITGGIHCVEAYLSDDMSQSLASSDTMDAIGASGAEIFHVTPEVFAKLKFGDRDDGILVVAETPRRTLDDLRLTPNPLVAVLAGLEKPGNVGAILRSADAAGIDAVIVADGRTDLYNPNTIRASVGTVFRENLCEATTAATIDWIRNQGLATIATRPDAEKLYNEADYTPGIAIILGSEAHGLSGAWRGTTNSAVRLPMRGIADSLNVSTTAAVLFYEALRQRGHGEKGDRKA